jgi:DNA polymerase-3 subunit beta
MKVLLEQKDLAPLVATASRGASTNSIVPVLAGIMLDAKGGKLTATALDLEIGVRVSTAEVQVENEGQVLVNARSFNDLVQKLPSGVITLEVKNSKLEVKYGRNRANLNILESNSWMGWPEEDRVEKFSIVEDVLRVALQQTAFAAAKNHFRPVFMGVLIDVCPEDGEIRFVGTDTHRLAIYTVKKENLIEKYSVVLPLKAVSELMRNLKGEGEIVLGEVGNNIVFARENLEIFSRTIEGQFPAYKTVIPQTLTSSFSFKTSALRECSERINALPKDDEKNKISALKIKTGTEVLLSAVSLIAGEVNEVFTPSENTGDDIEIVFNSGYFLDALKAMPEEAKISFAGAKSPAIVSGSENYLVVMVPLSVSAQN